MYLKKEKFCAQPDFQSKNKMDCKFIKWQLKTIFAL